MASEWKTVRLEEIAEVVDCPHSTPKWTESGVIVLRNQNIRNGRLDLSSPSFTDEIDYQKRIKRAKLQAGDLVFTREAPMGEVCQIPEKLRCCLGQRMVLIRADKQYIDAKYLLFVIQSPFLKHQIGWHEGTGTTVSNIRIPNIKAFKIPYFPLSEQERIAGILGSLDDKIENNRRMNETLEAMAAAIFKSWFVDFDPVHAKAAGKDTGLPKEIADLFPDSFIDSPLGKIPKGWKIKTIGELLELAYGKSLPATQRSGGQFPVYGSGGISGTHDEYFVKGPGIIVGRKGTVGTVYWEENDFFPIDTVFFIKPKVDIPMYWIFQRLSIMDIKKLGADSAVPGVNRNAVYAQKWIMPDKALMHEFSCLLQPKLSKIKANIEQNHILTKTRDILLPQLLSGEMEQYQKLQGGYLE